MVAEAACRAAPDQPNGVPAPAAAFDTDAMAAKAKASLQLALSPTKPAPKLAACAPASSSDGLQATGGSGSETPASAPATPSGDTAPLSATLRRQLLEAPNVADEIDSLRRQRADRRKEMNEASKKLRQDLPKYTTYMHIDTRLVQRVAKQATLLLLEVFGTVASQIAVRLHVWGHQERRKRSRLMKTASRLTQAELLQVMSLQVRLDERRKNKAESDKEADEEDVREEE